MFLNCCPVSSDEWSQQHPVNESQQIFKRKASTGWPLFAIKRSSSERSISLVANPVNLNYTIWHCTPQEVLMPFTYSAGWLQGQTIIPEKAKRTHEKCRRHRTRRSRTRAGWRGFAKPLRHRRTRSAGTPRGWQRRRVTAEVKSATPACHLALAQRDWMDITTC